MTGDDVHYKEWRITVIQYGDSAWEGLIYRPHSPLHETTVPKGPDRRVVIENAKAIIDRLLIS